MTDSVDLLPRRGLGDEDASFDAQCVAGTRESLRVVAGGCADHAVFPLFRVELQEEVERASDLVGAHRLQIFAFEVHGGAGEVGESFGNVQRGGDDAVSDSLGGVFDVRHGGWICRLLSLY